MDSARVITRKTVGRSALLCDLYDVRQDVFCGVSLLNSAPPGAAITSVDVPDIYSEYTTEHTYHDKFNKLNIEGGLKISVLAGLVPLSGSGKYLKDESISQKVIRGTLIYKMTTKEDSINLLQDKLHPHVITEHFRRAEATHVVSKIRWGAHVFVTFEKKVHNYSKAKEIAGMLQATLTKLAGIVETSADGHTRYSSNDTHEVDNFTIKVQGDVVPDQAAPQSVEQVLQLMRMIPQYVKMFNQGKGKPLEIELYPIKLLAPHFGFTMKKAKLKNDIDEASIMTVESEIDSSVQQRQILNDFLADVRDLGDHVSQEDLDECTRYQHRINIADAEFRDALKTAILAIRQEGTATSVLYDAIEKYRLNPDGTHKISIFMNKKIALKAKMDFFQVMKEKGVNFLPKSKSIDSFVAQHDKKDIYVLYYSDALRNREKENWQNTHSVFLELIKERNGIVETPDYGIADASSTEGEIPKFVVVDVELHHHGGTSIVIEQYSNGRRVTGDVVKDKSSALTQNIIIWEHIHKLDRCLQDTAVVRLICPLAIESKCNADRIPWVCYRCNQTMEYNFRDLFYCNCGGVLLQNCRFKCCDPNHGSQFRSFFSTEKLKELLPQVPDSNQANILLLGQTGVGKTTWINALRKCLEYPTLQDAIEGGIKVLIPSKFQHQGTTILVGEADRQEASTIPGDIGHSSTQSCRSHYFMTGGRRIQIIDTPGIGDTRGIKYDKENMEHILKYLEKEDQLHGICILLKPNECRLTDDFRYCLTSLLTNLHKHAANNIMFCYTHARSTLYSHGDTDCLVRKMVGDIRKVHGKDIPYHKKNTFFFDSESFRLLACIQNDIQFSEQLVQAFSGSWDNGQKESLRLLETILEVDPHVIAETVSMNDARKLITVLSRPLAEITNTITSNIISHERQRAEIKETKEEGAKLEACRYRNVEVLEVTQLQQPRTVCTAESCVDIVNSDVEYRTCHERCRGDLFQGVLQEGGWQMRFCSRINWVTGNCKSCHCSYTSHRQFTYNTRRVQESRTDESVEKLINENRSTKEIVQSTIDALSKEITELQNQQKKISSTSARFAVFLKENAICPINDSLLEYVDNMIEQRMMRSHSDHVKILKKMRKEYEKEKKLYEEKLAEYSSHSQSSGRMRPEDVQTMIAELEKLPRYGNKLREQVQASKKCTSRHITYHTKSTFSAPTSLKIAAGHLQNFVRNTAVLCQTGSDIQQLGS